MFKLPCIMFSVNSTVDSLGHQIYSSNSSGDPENENRLYRGGRLPPKITTRSAFRYLTYIPSVKTASAEIEICEIGIVGEYWNRNE